MRITFDEIPDSGLRVNITDQSWFPDREINHSGPVTASLFLERIGIRRVLATGRIETQIFFNCDRCLEETIQPFGFDFQTDLEANEKGGAPVIEKDHSCKENEMDVIYIDEPAVEVFDMLEQQVILAMPRKRLCSEGCKGLCGTCGKNRNVEECRCTGENKYSPFSALEKLKQ